MSYSTTGEEPPRTTPSVHARDSGQFHTLAIVPAFEEGPHIGSVVLQARPYVDEVLVVDDGSHDDTARIATAAGALVIRHDRNGGKGCALNTGLIHARQLGAMAVVLIDGDGQHRAEEIPTVLGPVLSGEADVVVGSRYLSPRAHVPRHRVLGHKALNWLTNAASGVRLSDSQNGFRALSRRALEAFWFSSQGFSVESEMQFLIQEHHLRVAEAPVTTLYYEKPKRSPVAQGLQVVGGTLRGASYYRPLNFLELPGLGMLVIGLAIRTSAIEPVQLSWPLVAALARFDAPMMFVGAQMFFAGVILDAIRSVLAARLHGWRVDDKDPEHDDNDHDAY
jgi:glycosyltransferase involved in cell wall biosynthesis